MPQRHRELRGIGDNYYSEIAPQRHRELCEIGSGTWFEMYTIGKILLQGKVNGRLYEGRQLRQFILFYFSRFHYTLDEPLCCYPGSLTVKEPSK